MKFNNSQHHAAYGSDFLCLTFDKRTGALAFLGLDSGGRDRDKRTTDNLLKPGLGALLPRTRTTVLEAGENGLRAATPAGAAFTCRMENDKSFTWRVDPGRREFLAMHLDIATAPPTIWAKTRLPRPDVTEQAHADPLLFAVCHYQLPLVIHFPDYGRIQIEAVEGDVKCVEHVRQSAEHHGLGLGYLNYGHHTIMNGLHHGHCRLGFIRKDKDAPVALRFTVLGEACPPLPFEDAADPAWNGLRRCWMNNFTLQRKAFTMGDNIALHGTAHLSVHCKADLLHVMDPADPQTCHVRRALERAVGAAFTHAQADDGEISWQYIRDKTKSAPVAAFIDTTPSNLIGLAGLAPRLARRHLDAALRAAGFLMRLDRDHDGILEVPFSGNAFDAPCPYPRPRNWWDNFGFGHKDIYFNTLCHRALRETAGLAERFGRTDDAAKIRAFLAVSDANFFNTFYNPATGLMAGWISEDGNVHDYLFTFAVAMPFNEGLIDAPTARTMLLKLLGQMRDMGFGDFRFGIPGPAMPVARADTIDWPLMGDWPMYENGGCCGMNAYHFLTALYGAGLRAEADAIFRAMLHRYDTLPTHTGLMPGYMKSVDWRTKDGNPCGYNYLADNYYFLLAAFTGRAGIHHPAVVRPPAG